MHVGGKFLALVLDPSISYSMYTCVCNFHFHFDIDPFFPLKYEKSRTIQKKMETSVMCGICAFAGLRESY